MTADPIDEQTAGRQRDIAEQLHLSPKTVDVHRARIMERLDLGDVASYPGRSAFYNLR